MKASETVLIPPSTNIFLGEEQLLAGIRHLEKSEGALIRVTRIEGDTVYVEVKNRMSDKRLSGFELLELAYSLLIKHLPEQYRLAIEL